jgi:hypothetical protein
VIQDGLKLQNTAGYGNLLYNMAILYGKLGNENLAGDYYRMSYNAYSNAGYNGSSKDDALSNAERRGK